MLLLKTKRSNTLTGRNVRLSTDEFLLLLRLLTMTVLCVVQVWTMIGIYLAIACLAVVVVAVFVDNLPSDLVDTKNNVRSEVCSPLLLVCINLCRL